MVAELSGEAALRRRRAFGVQIEDKPKLRVCNTNDFLILPITQHGTETCG